MLGRLGIDRKRLFIETADDFWRDIRVSELQRRLALILALGVFVCSAYILATASPWLLVEPTRFVPGKRSRRRDIWAYSKSIVAMTFLASAALFASTL
jgi:hypothetical protein